MTETETGENDAVPLAGRVAGAIREDLIAGRFAPGERLSEQQVAARHGISRNTLREVFRLLTSQGLLVHVPNRGIFVASPDEAAVLDIYRTRRVIQRAALEAAEPGHPALARMAGLVEESQAALAASDWPRVGTANMEFHRAMVELCDSPRLSACFDLVLAELRLVFGRLENTVHLHGPYVALNARLLRLVETGRRGPARRALDTYLARSERSVLAALARRPGPA